MPIRDSEKGRYPKDWPAISKRIRERAENRCEQCNAPNAAMIIRFRSEDYHGQPAYHVIAGGEMTGEVRNASTGEVLDYVTPGDIAGKAIRVVLTVAHLDHTPENCADENLMAWCQKCHLTYDAAHHAKNGKATRKSRKATGDLFAAVTP